MSPALVLVQVVASAVIVSVGGVASAVPRRLLSSALLVRGVARSRRHHGSRWCSRDRLELRCRVSRSNGDGPSGAWGCECG